MCDYIVRFHNASEYREEFVNATEEALERYVQGALTDSPWEAADVYVRNRHGEYLLDRTIRYEEE